MKEKLRILYLINNFGKGGAERFLVDLCTELKNYDDVEYIIGTLDCTNQYQDLTSGFIIKNLNYIPFSIFGEKKKCRL